MTRAQTVFAVALSAVALVILVVSGYVVASTRWGDRWYGRDRGRRSGSGRGTGG